MERIYQFPDYEIIRKEVISFFYEGFVCQGIKNEK